MKFRVQTAKKKSIRQIAGDVPGSYRAAGGSPYIAEAAEIVKDMDGTAYAQDAAVICLSDSKRCNNEKRLFHLYVYGRKKAQLPFLQNVIPT